VYINPGTGTHNHITFLREGKRVVGFECPRPSNMHAHLRTDAIMRAIAKDLMSHVYYLLLMPNDGHITTLEALEDRFHEVRAVARECGCDHVRFILTLFYTTSITPQVVQSIRRTQERLGIRIEVKWYPPEAGVTTGSGHGIPLDANRDEFRAMEDEGVPLLVHPESAFDIFGEKLHPFDGEAYFFNNVLWPFRDKRPKLRICGEHTNTAAGVEWVKADTSGNSFITITPHGAVCTMHDLEGPYGTFFKCKTRLQTRANRRTISEFMTSGDRRAGAGDDTAAHLRRTKLVPFDKARDGAFAGSEQTFVAYAGEFHRQRRLDDRFVRFTAFNALDWRGLERPREDDRLRFMLGQKSDKAASILVAEENDIVVPIPLGWSGVLTEDPKVGLFCEAVSQ